MNYCSFSQMNCGTVGWGWEEELHINAQILFAAFKRDGGMIVTAVIKARG